MGVLIGFRLMVQRESVGRFFRRFVRAYTSRNTANSIFRVVHLSAGAFRSFITGQLKEAVALGCMCYLGMIIFGFPYAGATSAVIGFCAIIPVFGAWIGGAAGALLSLTASPIKALLFIVFIVCLQAFDNNFVYPRIVGNSMNLPGLLVLLAVLIGGDIAGAAGMLLGVPLCSVMYTLINTSISNRLEKKKLEEKEEKEEKAKI
jgi:predicted PurR-regulated permease PerM